MDKLDLKTKDLRVKNIEKLVKLFPELLTEIEKDGKLIKTIDSEKLKELVGDYADKDSEFYELSWAGKQKSKQKIVKPINKTLRPVIKDSVDFENTENLYIEGDNFEVLKLLQESYLNKVKMIYIDPPYNTGKDFIYKDNFKISKEEYDKESGAVDEDGNKFIKNTKTNGRFHSDWLSMMYERLVIAKDLLKDDGVIFISIDDNEVTNLRKICDEIFGESNSLDRGTLIWINKGSTKGFNKIVKNHEYILAYAKNSDLIVSLYGNNNPNELDIIEERLQIKRSKKNPLSRVKFPKGLKIEGIKNIKFEKSINKGTNRIDIIKGNMEFKNGVLIDTVILEASFPYKNQMIDFFNKLGTNKKTLDYKGQEWIEVFFTKRGIPYFRKKRKFIILSSVLDNVPNSGYYDLKKLGMEDLFSNPKPVELIKTIIDYFSTEGDIIMDFFSGSSTTMQSVFELYKNPRNCILIQYPENLDIALKKGDINNKTVLETAINFLDSINKPHFLTEIGKERIRRAAKKIKEDNKDKDLSNVDFGFRVFKIDSSNMKDVYYNPNEINQTILTNLKDNVKEDRTEQDLLFQVLLDMNIPLDPKITKEKIDNKKILRVNDNFLIACFDDKVDLELVKKIVEYKPKKLVFKDSSFKDDSTKINIDEYIKNKLPNTIIKVI